MPTTPEAIAADIAEAADRGFRGRLIARGQARAIIWRDGALPPDAPAFAPQLSYDLHSYGYAPARARPAPSRARRRCRPGAHWLSSKPPPPLRRSWPRAIARRSIATSTSSWPQPAYHLAHLSARAYSPPRDRRGRARTFSPIERSPCAVDAAEFRCSPRPSLFSTIGPPARVAMRGSPPASRTGSIRPKPCAPPTMATTSSSTGSTSR